jgi:hypothetical protein
MNAVDSSKLRLSDVLADLAGELRKAQRKAAADSKPDVFKLSGCTIELGVSWETKAEGGVEFWVVKLGGGAARAEAESIILTLEPVGEGPVVGTRSNK